MFKYIKTFYDFLMTLKQYHAVHVIVIPPVLFYLISNLFIIKIIIAEYNKSGVFDIDLSIIIAIFTLVYYSILIWSIEIAAIIEIIILIRQFITKEKIYVKSNILLNSKLYNTIYLIFLVHIILLCIITCFKLYNYYFVLYIIPLLFKLIT